MNKFFAIAAVVAGLMTIGPTANAETVCSLSKMGRAAWTKCLYRQRYEHYHPEETKKKAETPIVCSLSKMGRAKWEKCLYAQRAQNRR